MHWHVTTVPMPSTPTANARGYVTNIPFEERVSDVTEYWADYWMLYKGKQKYLAYTQTMLMVLTITKKPKKKGQHDGECRKYIFPHVTCNTVTYC